MKLNVKSLLKNKYVLYATLFIAITNVLGYLALNDFRSLAFFVGVAMLSTYFSKNMIINLGSAILITNIVFGKSILEGYATSSGVAGNRRMLWFLSPEGRIASTSPTK